VQKLYSFGHKHSTNHRRCTPGRQCHVVIPTGLRQKPDFKQPPHVLVRWVAARIHHCPRTNPDAGRTVARGRDGDLDGRIGGVQQLHRNGLPRHCSVVPTDVLPINGKRERFAFRVKDRPDAPAIFHHFAFPRIDLCPPVPDVGDPRVAVVIIPVAGRESNPYLVNVRPEQVLKIKLCLNGRQPSVSVFDFEINEMPHPVVHQFGLPRVAVGVVVIAAVKPRFLDDVALRATTEQGVCTGRVHVSSIAVKAHASRGRAGTVGIHHHGKRFAGEISIPLPRIAAGKIKCDVVLGQKIHGPKGNNKGQTKK
jgi:hypothetical protein